MKISVIIATYNNVRWLEMILTMLRQQTCMDFEVVIADDGSNSENVQKTRQLMQACPFPVQHVWHEDIGWRKDKILNEAVLAARADYLVFLDGDCIPDQYFIEDYMSLRRQGEVAAGRRVQLTDKETQEISSELLLNGYLDRLFWKCLLSGRKHAEDILRIKCSTIRKWLHADKEGGVLGCNFGLYKSDLLIVNGFDEDYPHPGCGEDSDLEARLSRAGIPAVRRRFICRVYHRKHKSAIFQEEENVRHFQWNEANGIIAVSHGIRQHDSEARV